MRLNAASVVVALAALSLPPLCGARFLDRVTSTVTQVTAGVTGGVTPAAPLPRTGKAVEESAALNLSAMPDPSLMIENAIGGIRGVVDMMTGVGREIDKGRRSVALRRSHQKSRRFPSVVMVWVTRS